MESWKGSPRDAGRRVALPVLRGGAWRSYETKLRQAADRGRHRGHVHPDRRAGGSPVHRRRRRRVHHSPHQRLPRSIGDRLPVPGRFRLPGRRGQRCPGRSWCRERGTTRRRRCLLRGTRDLAAVDGREHHRHLQHDGLRRCNVRQPRVRQRPGGTGHARGAVELPVAGRQRRARRNRVGSSTMG